MKNHEYVHWSIGGWEEGERRERARVGIEPTAAAPSQPDCPGVSHSDHSTGSKETAS